MMLLAFLMPNVLLMGFSWVWSFSAVIKGARGFATIAALSEPMKISIPTLNKLC